MKKVWVLYRELINWQTKDVEADWWVNKTEERAKAGFDSELDAFYERFGKRRPEDCTYYELTDQMAIFKFDEYSFALYYQEDPIFTF